MREGIDVGQAVPTRTNASLSVVTKMRQVPLAVGILLIIGWASVTGAQGEELTAKSDPAMQAQIKAAVNILLPLAEAGTPNWRAVREFKKLKDLADGEEQIIEQLAIYAIAERGDQRQPDLEAFSVLYRLDLRPGVIIRVLAPYLGADHPQLRDFAGIWFLYHDSNDRRLGRPPLGCVNYDDYEEYVGNRMAGNKEIPAGFTTFIYERHPGKALLVFAYGSRYPEMVAQQQAMRKVQAMRDVEAARQEQETEGARQRLQRHVERGQARVASVRARREIELAERIVSNAIWLKENGFDERFQVALPQAIHELATLANHKEWWARLYVAYIMRQHRELREPAIVQQLIDDPDPLVSKTAKSIRQ